MSAPSGRRRLPPPVPRGAGGGLLLALLCAAPALVRAQEPPPAAPPRARASPISVEVGPRALRFGYAELDDRDRELDAEDGVISGMQGGVAWSAARWFARLEGWAANGSVDYTGETQSTSPSRDGLAIASTTRMVMLGGSVEAGGWLPLPLPFGVALVAGGSYHSWERGIQPTTARTRTGIEIPVAGLDETYAWGEWHAGLRVRSPALGRWTLGAEAQLRHGIRPKLAVVWGTRTVRLDLVPEPGLRAGVDAQLAIDGWPFVVLAVNHERRAFGASEPDPETRIWEPRSEMATWDAAVRLGARF